MSALQVCWIAVAACTVIFLIVAAVSPLPKMKAPYTAMIASIFLAASGITAFGSIAPYLSPPGSCRLPQRARTSCRRPVPGAPLANDASAGKVVFTFDEARTPTRARSSPS